ncbi:hypothetical protein EJ07DRAFT_158964 [Lizonia empirigonia]|nr:hypothetical protein EJ07DRAFT_158964 [Lizonia empirigonia]
MLPLRPFACVFVLVELCIVFLGTIKYRSDFQKKNAGQKPKRNSTASEVGLCVSGFIFISMIVAAGVLSTETKHEQLFVALVQSASVILAIAETVRTSQVLELDTPPLIYGGWTCSLANLVLSFSPLILAHGGYINNEKWYAYFNAPALFMASIMYVVSAYLMSTVVLAYLMCDITFKHKVYSI